MTEDDCAWHSEGVDTPEVADVDELLSRAEDGDWHAARVLANVLAGVQPAPPGRSTDIQLGLLAERLADLLAGEGEGYAARVLADVHAVSDTYTGYKRLRPLFERLADILAERGDLDRLRARAESGDFCAGNRLDQLLVERRDVNGLRARAEAGAGSDEAAWGLADILAERGDLDGLRALADARPPYSTYPTAVLARLLAERGEVRELRKRAYRPDSTTAWVLADLLIGRGDNFRAIQVLETIAGFQDNRAADKARFLRAGYPYWLAAGLTWIILCWLPAGVAVGVPAGLRWGLGAGIAFAMTLGLVLGIVISGGFFAVTGEMIPAGFVTWLITWIFRPLTRWVSWLIRPLSRRPHPDKPGHETDEH